MYTHFHHSYKPSFSSVMDPCFTSPTPRSPVTLGPKGEDGKDSGEFIQMQCMLGNTPVSTKGVFFQLTSAACCNSTRLVAQLSGSNTKMRWCRSDSFNKWGKIKEDKMSYYYVTLTMDNVLPHVPYNVCNKTTHTNTNTPFYKLSMTVK